ncbi:unnamed protein product [Prunus armeniaca]|uniref:S-protein homolog n=1 Tax=Prunus armeniaca TaxID=36596 RepID=A0A6J5VXG1_PRUAR|nr:unnamed protein product [Prunus armeniaca]
MSSLGNVVMPLLVILFITTSVDGAFLDAPKDVVVRITNALQNNVNLTVHCKSGDDDLGVQTLRINENFEFNFQTNIFGNTLFFCGFKWSNEFRWFDIFTDKRDDCSSCYWTIIELGPCLYGIDGLCYQWNKH